MRTLLLIICLWSFLFPSERFEKSSAKIGYLKLKDKTIDFSTHVKLRSSFKHFIEKRVDMIILELNTEGGEIVPTLKIVDLIKKVQIENRIRVIAYINKTALSVSGLLAYACEIIGISPHASMGAVQPSQGNFWPVSEKGRQALRREFANLATFWGRDPNIAEAMVDMNAILVKRNKKIVHLDEENEIEWSERPDLYKADKVIKRYGQVLTLGGKELIKYKVADFEASSFYECPLLTKIPHLEILTFENWKSDLYSLFSHPIFASLLGLGLFLGVYLEIVHPRNLSFIFSAVCFVFVLLSRYMFETAMTLEVSALTIGIFIIFFEIFILRKFELEGFFSILLIICSLVSILLPHFDPIQFISSWKITPYSIIDRLAWVSETVLIVGIFAVFLVPRFRRLVKQGKTV